ncbi:MaoC family dehydratase [Aquabacterium sp. A7-Y]|uniref:MaoC family dehydratase n=1 Tax=Aquabacterium sp. A7-Y TaxID=1349605 RepID=UPI00223CF419|nr:MaoC family dehydratase [Aquabacterium sp. A7-Y]MCW7538481.1 MaoC family dehydratase [Aquabacterium sp. A7-Y]
MTAAPTPTYYWEDFAAGSVREFGGTLVNKDDVIRFASEFDPQPFHLDEDAARASLFGGLAASGWHTCAMVMRMMCDAYLLDSASLGSPGLEKLQWLKPVYPGDVLRVRMTILESRPMNSKPHVGLIRSQWEAIARRRDGREDVVLQMEGWGMFRRRNPGEAGPAA